VTLGEGLMDGEVVEKLSEARYELESVIPLEDQFHSMTAMGEVALVVCLAEEILVKVVEVLFGQIKAVEEAVVDAMVVGLGLDESVGVCHELAVVEAAVAWFVAVVEAAVAWFVVVVEAAVAWFVVVVEAAVAWFVVVVEAAVAWFVVLVEAVEVCFAKMEVASEVCFEVVEAG
jgi:hypothetical protein